jgi:hypothetical protein
LKGLSDDKELGFEGVNEITYEAAFERIEKICDFYRDLQNQAKTKKTSKFMYEPVLPVISGPPQALPVQPT